MPNAELIEAVKKARHGRNIQAEAHDSLRRLLPNTADSDLVIVAQTIAELLPDAPQAAPVAEAPVAQPKRAPKAKTPLKGKPFNRNEILATLRTKFKNDTMFQATDLAEACGLASAQPLSPLLNSLRKRGALKRYKRKDGIFWTTIPEGLKVYIKEVESLAA